jgi:hypothetical protein
MLSSNLLYALAMSGCNKAIATVRSTSEKNNNVIVEQYHHTGITYYVFTYCPQNGNQYERATYTTNDEANVIDSILKASGVADPNTIWHTLETFEKPPEIRSHYFRSQT